MSEDYDEDNEHVEPNNQLILIGGESGSGKSVSLRNIRDPESWVYANCEGKRLPFKHKFMEVRVTDPYEVHAIFDQATEADSGVAGIIVDTSTFLMDMYETQYVLQASNTMKAWGNYAQFFKILMQEKITKFNRPVIILAHVREDLDEAKGEMKTQVPIKGSLKNNGVEAYFSTVVAAKKLQTKHLKDYDPKLLTVTDEEDALGFKHVFQTRLTKQTVNERIRSPMGLFEPNQTYIDNDAQLLLDHLARYYN